MPLGGLEKKSERTRGDSPAWGSRETNGGGPKGGRGAARSLPICPILSHGVISACRHAVDHFGQEVVAVRCRQGNWQGSYGHRLPRLRSGDQGEECHPARPSPAASDAVASWASTSQTLGSTSAQEGLRRMEESCLARSAQIGEESLLHCQPSAERRGWKPQRLETVCSRWQVNMAAGTGAERVAP